MSRTQVITIGFGKANFSNVVATVAALKVETPFNRVSAMTSGVAVSGSKTWIPAGLHEMNAGFTRLRTEHENGRIILLQAAWNRGGSPLREGAIFIRLRHGAPLYEISARVPTSQGNVCGDIVQVFEGTGDILSPDEMKVAGIEIPRFYAQRYLSEEEIMECFRISLIRGETVARPSLQSVVTSAGIEVREVANLPQRRIRIRRS